MKEGVEVEVDDDHLYKGGQSSAKTTEKGEEVFLWHLCISN